ncbi:MAG: efflux RND transporter periplasmic adaptor subunit [Bacteroidota bacterium]
MRLTVVFALTLALGACSDNDRDTIEASGTIEGTDINIGAEVGGKVVEVRVEEGTEIHRGDTLIVIDDTEYRIQLRQALANLASFESAYRLAVAGSRKEDLIQAEAVLKNAEGDYERMKSLLASNTVTQKQYDDAYARYVAAEQTYRKLKTGLRPEEIEGARVRRDYAAAQADLLRKKVRDCVIVAPTDGTVTLRGLEPGELVTPGMTVMRLTHLSTVTLTIYINEAELGRVRLGQEASVSIDAYGSGRSFPGRVVYISPLAEFTPKNVQTKEERTKLVFGVKIEVENPDHALKPGLPADARLSAPRQQGA